VPLEPARLELPGELSALPGQEPDSRTLLSFALRQPRAEAAACGLDWLGGDLADESWCTGQEVRTGRLENIVWRRAGHLLLLALEQQDDPAMDPCERVDSAYDRLLAAASALDCPRMLRTWNYLPGINAGDGDRERYRRFCLGRGAALERAGYGNRELCAGTAIGSDEPRLRIYLLCASEAGMNIENPRQVSAYRYPRQYGPRSPSFARATAISGLDDSVVLMISGTASVVGHRSVHQNDTRAQLAEIICNLDSLLDESARRLGRAGLRDFSADSLLRVYVRRADDWTGVERQVRRRWPDVRLAGLRGDICRADLLVEVEAVTCG